MTFNIQESTHEDIGVVRSTEHRISSSLNLTHIIAVDSFLQNFWFIKILANRVLSFIVIKLKDIF
jgi:hypothetical protein